MVRTGLVERANGVREQGSVWQGCVSSVGEMVGVGGLEERCLGWSGVEGEEQMVWVGVSGRYGLG